MAHVTILQRVLPHYRIPFFTGLHEALNDIGVELTLLYGREYPGQVPRTVPLNLPWCQEIDNRYFGSRERYFVLQPAFNLLKKTDLVITEQANALLINYFLLFRRLIGITPMAYWGHGRNMQSTKALMLSEYLKQKLVKQSDWWFAYTNISKETVAKTGFPSDRITVVQNSVDTTVFRQQLASIKQKDIIKLKAGLGISSNNVLLYCGGMYPEKQLDFLISSCLLIKKEIEDLVVIFIGSGSEQYKIEEASSKYIWMHYAGPKYDLEKALFFKAASALVIPGLVGLAIVDGFAAGLPLFTTDIPIHSPEIDYLKIGKNGFISDHDKGSYAEQVSSYLLSSDEYKRIIEENCLKYSDEYTIENMVNRFSSGIESCLRIKGRL